MFINKKMHMLKNLLSSFDIYGITYSFRYKDKEKYQTITGGIIVILFLILVLFVGIYYFIPFMHRKNYTIVYYTMNLAATDEINLFQTESNFAIGIECESNSKEKLSVHDLLDFKSNYVLYEKLSNGSYVKHKKNIKTHKCTYEDFYNKLNKQVDYLGLSKFECLEDKGDTLQGIFSDKIFTYYEFTALAKNDSVLNELDRFLFENDCKLQLFYMDIIIDLLNYKEPITQYMNELFIQLNPTLFIKRNVFYMNQQFSDDNYLLFVFGDDDNIEIKTLYSRYEEYSLYMGFNRNITRPYNYANYAKLYLRADLKRTIVKRKYQKIFEFYADASSLLVALYEILFLIFNYIDNFYAFHNLSNNLFFFKGVEEDDNNFNIFKKRSQIKGIISYINQNSSEEKTKDDFKGNNKNKDIDINTIENVELQKGIKIYSNYKITTPESRPKGVSRLKMIENKEKNMKTKLINKNILKNNNFSNKEYEKNSKENDLNSANITKRNKFSINNINNQDSVNSKSNVKEDFSFKKSINNNNLIDSSNSDNSKNSIKKYNKKVKYSFNIFEIVITQFLKCCMSKSMKIKNYVNQNSNEIIYDKLNIITYIRNMILFDILNRTFMDDNKREIVNFLCRPIITVNKNKKNSCDEFYKIYSEEDFDKFTNNIKGLAKKPGKLDMENRLISISNEQLKTFV